MGCLLQGLFSIILSIRITKQIQFLNSHVFSFGTFVKVSFESTIFTKLSDRREVRLWLHPGLGPSTRGFRILLAGLLYFLPICGFLVPQLSTFSNSFSPLRLSRHFENQFYVQCCNDGMPSNPFSLSISRWISCASFGTSFCVGCSFYLVTL